MTRHGYYGQVMGYIALVLAGLIVFAAALMMGCGPDADSPVVQNLLAAANSIANYPQDPNDQSPDPNVWTWSHDANHLSLDWRLGRETPALIVVTDANEWN
jgi:hypothetical protein